MSASLPSSSSRLLRLAVPLLVAALGAGAPPHATAGDPPTAPSAGPRPTHPAAPSASDAEVRPNDNTHPAGRRRGRVVALVLEPRAARWTPVPGDAALARPVLAWAEAGGAPQLPGPLVRARVGDTLRVTVRNPLARTLHVVGLADRGDGAWGDTLHVAAGDSAVRVIRLTRAGGFWYDAVTTHPADPPPRATPFPDKHHPPDETLVGAFVVDEADAPADAARRERVFVLHVGARPETAVMDTLLARRGQLSDNQLYVNGTAWPGTERLRYAVGDTVRWRLINAAFLPHPMHLHGFYFRVDARGDAARDTAYAPADRRMAVTELLDGFTTARLTWVPERAGNWLFHCHLLRHMAPFRAPPRAEPRVRALAAQLAAADSVARATGAPAVHAVHAVHAAHDPAAPTSGDPTAHARAHMAGLVLGIHVADAPAAPRPAAPVTRRSERRLDLWVTERTTETGRAYGYVLQEGAAAPAPDSVRRPGTPIVVTRGTPVAITVHNTRAVPVAVHWHGMELESRYDGVGGWSGTGRSVTPSIPAGGTFVARFTPPRAGTFMYHTHDESGDELAGGLYGALLVRDAAARPGSRAPADAVVLLGAGTTPGPRDPRGVPAPPVPFVNADTGVTPIALAADAPTRLRLVNIAGSDLKHVQLVDAAGAPLRWRIVGKDGWTPPAAQRARVREATLLVGVGETYDLLLDAADARRAAALRVETRYYPGSPPVLRHVARVPVRAVAMPSVPVPSVAASTSDAATDSAAVQAAAAAFLQAFDRLDEARFAEAWAPDVTVFMPDARAPHRFDGRDAVLGYFRSMFADVRTRAAPGTTPTLRIVERVRDLRVSVLAPGAAVVSFHLGDDPAPGRRTVVWRRAADGVWRIAHLHASRLAAP